LWIKCEFSKRNSKTHQSQQNKRKKKNKLPFMNSLAVNQSQSILKMESHPIRNQAMIGQVQKTLCEGLLILIIMQCHFLTKSHPQVSSNDSYANNVQELFCNQRNHKSGVSKITKYKRSDWSGQPCPKPSLASSVQVF
jgi:hypothetical protein